MGRICLGGLSRGAVLVTPRGWAVTSDDPTSSVTVSVRPAVPADASLIARAHVRAWQAAYAGLMPDGFLDALGVEERADVWGRYLRTPLPDDRRVEVVVVDGQVQGFATFGEARDEESAGTGELYAINLHPDAWGLGAGSVLLRHVHDGLSGMGYETAILWVVPGNTRARRFYEAHGWVVQDAERTAEVMGATVPEVRYGRVLGVRPVP